MCTTHDQYICGFDPAMNIINMHTNLVVCKHAISLEVCCHTLNIAHQILCSKHTKPLGVITRLWRTDFYTPNMVGYGVLSTLLVVGVISHLWCAARLVGIAHHSFYSVDQSIKNTLYLPYIQSKGLTTSSIYSRLSNKNTLYLPYIQSKGLTTTSTLDQSNKNTHYLTYIQSKGLTTTSTLDQSNKNILYLPYIQSKGLTTTSTLDQSNKNTHYLPYIQSKGLTTTSTLDQSNKNIHIFKVEDSLPPLI